MPSFEEKAVFRQKNYIQNKFKSISQETGSVIELLQKCLHIFNCRVNDLVLSDGDIFISLYRKLNNDFETFQEKLMYVQATIDLPLDNNQISNEVSGANTVTTFLSNSFEQSCDTNSYKKDLNCLDSSFSRSHENHNANDIVCNTVPKSVPSSSSTSYTSIRDIGGCGEFQNDLPEITAAFSFLNQDNLLKGNLMFEHLNQNPLNETIHLEQSLEDVLSIESVSQSSCYRSLSSNFSDLGYQFASKEKISNDFTIKSSQQNESPFQYCQVQLKKIVCPPNITVPVTVSAMLTHIENPGNFWMQLENSESSRLIFPKEKFRNSDSLSYVKEGDFCLAPSKSVPYYSRVKILSEAHSHDMDTRVLFIDQGSTQSVKLNDLRVMPQEAYNVPMQAIHCFLADISAPNNIWCYAAIQKMKEFSNNTIETHVKIRNCDTFGVQLIATTYMFDEEFSCDIGQALCYDNFAIANEEPLETEEPVLTPISSDDTKLDSHQISNHISCDSGVSVTSNGRSNQSCQQIQCSSEAINSLEFYVLQEMKNDYNFQGTETSENDPKHLTTDLISFESVENLCSQSIENQEDSDVNQQDNDELMLNQCLKICTCSCPLHLLIPFPSINFVEEDMVLVMMSHIVNPNEFYVNMAMETSTTLDDLLEQMTLVYSCSTSPGVNTIILEDLKEGMFCAAQFDDGNWYRVKVLSIHLKFDQTPNVYVQYIDYGNKAWIRNTDLRTLTPEFAKSPSYSVKCSLAGITPAAISSCNGELATWNEDALRIFKDMLDFEHCLTAQICDRTTILNEDPLQVLLWDTQKSQDVLINKTFADSGSAEFDLKLLEELFRKQEKKCKEIEAFHQWDPMADEYCDIQNSYGVHVDDFQVAITGYKQNDEKYTCKYYSLRGYCPRGPHCPCEHVPLAEGGVTRDKEELYAFNTCPPLPQCEKFILATISSVLTPSHFYIQLPFGEKTVDEIDALVNSGADEYSLINQEVKALHQALNIQYSNLPFDERTTVALAYGNIVVAQRQFDQAWHRGRIIDVHDIDGKAKVFYVDFGNEEWVERRNIRQIQPEFLHLPFQAIECCLYDVEPLGFEEGRKWTADAISHFENLVSETTLLVYIADKCNDILHVSLKRTTENDHNTVAEHLIKEGFAQNRSCAIKKYQESRYVPG